MALLLHIETATPAGSVCFSRNGKIILERMSTTQKDHAAVIVPFIHEMMAETAIRISQIDAIVMSGGPGSYTGLRVAASTAKGLCYAWGIPLIAISTLKAMANGMKMFAQECNEWAKEGQRQFSEGTHKPVSEAEPEQTFFCPMIDARRMEVFTALYDDQLNECIAPKAVILQDDFLSEYKNQKVIIAGTGQPKAQKILQADNLWHFLPFENKASHLILPAEKAFEEKDFVDTAYFDPFYLKSVYLPGKK